jgi:hypothetical protein
MRRSIEAGKQGGRERSKHPPSAALCTNYNGKTDCLPARLSRTGIVVSASRLPAGSGQVLSISTQRILLYRNGDIRLG